MIWYPVRAFLYGFIFFGGAVLITDLAFSRDYSGNPIWGISATVKVAAIGGATFVISWAALWLLWRIFVELIRKAPDA